MSTLTERARAVAALIADRRPRLLHGETAHDRHWRAHPAVATDEQLSFSQRAADVMRNALSTWTFLLLLAATMAAWIVTGGFGHDPGPYILLNLCLSTLAGVQAVVLLIAAKRADQIAAAVALHTLENTEKLTALIEQNTALTEQVRQLTSEVHARLEPPPASAPKPMRRVRSTASVK